MDFNPDDENVDVKDDTDILLCFFRHRSVYLISIFLSSLQRLNWQHMLSLLFHISNIIIDIIIILFIIAIIITTMIITTMIIINIQSRRRVMAGV